MEAAESSSVASIVRRLRVDDALRAAVAAELGGGGGRILADSSSSSGSSSSGSDAASSHGSGDGHGAGSLFKLTCSPFAENTEACDVMDLSLLGLMLLGLVIVTVVIELLVEHLEESLGGVGKVLKEKVFKECALLGIVSFAALVSWSWAWASSRAPGRTRGLQFGTNLVVFALARRDAGPVPRKP